MVAACRSRPPPQTSRSDARRGRAAARSGSTAPEPDSRGAHPFRGVERRPRGASFFSAWCISTIRPSERLAASTAARWSSHIPRLKFGTTRPPSPSSRAIRSRLAFSSSETPLVPISGRTPASSIEAACSNPRPARVTSSATTGFVRERTATRSSPRTTAATSANDSDATTSSCANRPMRPPAPTIATGSFARGVTARTARPRARGSRGTARGTTGPPPARPSAGAIGRSSPAGCSPEEHRLRALPER